MAKRRVRAFRNHTCTERQRSLLNASGILIIWDLVLREFELLVAALPMNVPVPVRVLCRVADHR